MVDPIAGWRDPAPQRGPQPEKTTCGCRRGARRAVRESDLLAFVGLVGLTFVMLTSSVTVAMVA